MVLVNEQVRFVSVDDGWLNCYGIGSMRCTGAKGMENRVDMGEP